MEKPEVMRQTRGVIRAAAGCVLEIVEVVRHDAGFISLVGGMIRKSRLLKPTGIALSPVAQGF